MTWHWAGNVEAAIGAIGRGAAGPRLAAIAALAGRCQISTSGSPEGVNDGDTGAAPGTTDSMRRGHARLLRSAAIGLIAAMVLAAVVLCAPAETADLWRESVADRILLGDPPSSDALVVVDIDNESLARAGPWPWPRGRLSELLHRVVDGKPSVVALDIVLSGHDASAPAALLDHFPNASEQLRRAVAALDDPDVTMAAAIAAGPAVLSMLFADVGETPTQTPIIIAGAPPALSPWVAGGAELPLPMFVDAAAALGVGSLAEDADGLVRRVPLLGGAGDAVVSGLAAAALRLSQGAGSFILDGDEGKLRIGDLALPLDLDVSLRLRLTPPEEWPARTVSAGQVLSGSVPPDRFAGRIVLIGGGAPALGALRATKASQVTPSLQIQADAVATALSGNIPFRPPGLYRLEAAAFVLLAVLGAMAGAGLGPLVATGLMLVLAAQWAGGAAVAIGRYALIVDAVTPAMGGLVAVVAAGTASAVAHRRQASAVRRRFEKHLAPAVVARLVDRPDLVRLEGERREVTVLMTDIEGFTAMTERIGPAELIHMLDAYFSGLVKIVLDHGGMIDKFVGDAALCIFNAPLDLSNHPRRALEAAEAIVAFSVEFCGSDGARAAGMGRTRVGIETGEVVIGDVGGGERFDYTVIGSAVNTAARLEGMNKKFGTSICVGPTCRSRIPDRPFKALGALEVRGRGLLELFAPEP